TGAGSMVVGRVAPSTNPPCQGTGWRKELDSTNRSGLRGACGNDSDIASALRALKRIRAAESSSETMSAPRMKVFRRTFLRLAVGAAALPAVSHIARAQS